MAGKEIIARVCEELGARTFADLAALLGVTKASVYGYSHKPNVPDKLYLQLLDGWGLNPVWVRTGEGPKCLAPVAKDAPVFLSLDRLATEELVSELQRRLPGSAVILAPVTYRADIDAGL